MDAIIKNFKNPEIRKELPVAERPSREEAERRWQPC